MTNHGDLQAAIAQEPGDSAGGLALARAGSHRADRHDPLPALQHRRMRAEQHEVRAGSIRDCGPVHHVHVRDVAVGEDNLSDCKPTDERSELVLLEDGNAFGIQRSCELTWMKLLGVLCILLVNIW